MSEQVEAPPANAAGNDAGEKELGPSRMPWVFAALTGAVVVAAFLVMWRDYQPSPGARDAWAERGQVGDFLGGHLSGLGNIAAFLMMFAAMLLQREELKLQRKELQESKLVAKQSAASQEQLAAAQSELIQAQSSLALATRLQVDQRNLELLEADVEDFVRRISNKQAELESKTHDLVYQVDDERFRDLPDLPELLSWLEDAESAKSISAEHLRILHKLRQLQQDQEALESFAEQPVERCYEILAEAHAWRLTLPSQTEVAEAAAIRAQALERLTEMRELRLKAAAVIDA